MLELTHLDFINVGKTGTFNDSGKVKTSPQQVDELFNYLAEKDVEKLLIYFHGGLVSEKNGLEAAKVMTANFTNPAEKRHLVSFVWETGPKEVILENIDSIINKTKTSYYNEAIKFVIKLVAKRLGVKDTKGGGGVYLTDTTIEEEKGKTFPFEYLDRELEDTKGTGAEDLPGPSDERVYLAKLEIESRMLIQNQATESFKSITTDDDPDLTQELRPDENGDAKGGWLTIAKVVAQIAFRVLKRYYNKTHHDFYPTVMEETFRKLYVGHIGTWGWSHIKDKAKNMFADNTGLSGDNLHAGSYFLDLLQKHSEKRIGEGKDFKVHLIGHSAGTIVICFLMKAVTDFYRDITFDTIFFLAPACRTDLFLSHCRPAKESGHFRKFKMFTMKAENEKKDHCIPFVYTHSLLYMVSGLFELDGDGGEEIDAKIMGLNEQFMATGRYAAFPELKELNLFLSAHPLILSDDNTNADLSLRSNALKHGDFDNDLPTLSSILNSL